jgi:hypothetical protein
MVDMTAALFLAQQAQNAKNSLNTQYGNAKQEYNTNYYDPYTKSGDAANTLYSNALGLNGASGNAAATQAYQTSPGYNFQLQQGTQALDRSAAGAGLFGSGNAATALTQYGQGLANQDYGNWLARLQGLGAQGLTAASGQTGRQGSLANIDTGLGNALAGIDINSANSIVNAYNNANAMQESSRSSFLNNLTSGLLGGAQLGLKALSVGGLACDRNMKTDIEYIGRDETTGLDMYAYRYKSDPKTYPKVIGPMAQDVAKLYPDMVMTIGDKLVIKVV